MSSFVEARLAFVAIAIVAALPLASCARDKTCSPEICNYADDDCDYRYDEDFRDARGLYVSPDHCGGCNVKCSTALPTAAETRCVVDETAGAARCEIVSCPAGSHLGAPDLCVPDVTVFCMPCRSDADCAFGNPLSACAAIDSTTGIGRCAEPCDASCAAPFACATIAGKNVCAPMSSDACTCGVGMMDAKLGCLVTSALGHVCAGERLCTAGVLGACEAALVEACNHEDDNCNDEIDEDFRDPTTGAYVSQENCGDCNQPCVAPGPHMSATCLADATVPSGARCEIACDAGFVDVNGIPQDGCECQRWDGTGPPPAAGGDSNCDGVPDDSTEFVYVTQTGNDSGPGSLANPMRTIGAALARGAAVGKSVLVARGIYAGPVSLVAGVDVYGGYRPDFRDRDLTLFPVVIESSAEGTPALVCQGIRTATRVEGFTVQASDGLAAGEGSTAVFLDGCGPEVSFADLLVYAASGADGANGASSSDNAAASGLPSLTALDGAGGSMGVVLPDSAMCMPVAGGNGGTKICFGVDVSGGHGGGTGCPDIHCANGSACPNAGCTDYTNAAGVCDIATVLSLAVANEAPGDGRGTSVAQGGERTYNAPTSRGTCSFCDDNPTLARDGARGDDGTWGTDGVGGLGCAASPTLDVVTGRMKGGAGTDGGAGTNGSGGGGGSGGSGYAVIAGTEPGCSNVPGGSGGGGGSGGCGAPIANGGSGGGASIGVLIRLANGLAIGPSLARVRVVTANGGDGGDGGVAAAGGTPGAGALGGTTRFWCARAGGRGGDGGAGGSAGGGGGGCGGDSHAVLVATSGAAVDAYAASLRAGVTVDLTGNPGRSGLGGYSPRFPGMDGRGGAGDPVAVFP